MTSGAGVARVTVLSLTASVTLLKAVETDSSLKCWPIPRSRCSHCYRLIRIHLPSLSAYPLLSTASCKLLAKRRFQPCRKNWPCFAIANRAVGPRIVIGGQPR